MEMCKSENVPDQDLSTLEPSHLPTQKSFRFLHVSTDEVYGSLAPDAPGFSETHPYDPHSPYSASKAASDHLVRAWHRTYGLPILITNCSNNYGPRQFPEKLIPLMLLNALEGKPLPVYGNGQQIRDWLYVEDHARALVHVATKGTVGETYNIGGHNEITNLEVVQTLCNLLDELSPTTIPKGNNIAPSSPRVEGWGEGDNQPQPQPTATQNNIAPSPPRGEGWGEGANQPPTHASLITHVKDRPGHDHRYAIDATKIEKDLGWAPEETFETGLRKTVQWYLDNTAWWQKVQDGSYRGERLGVRA